VQNTAFSTKKTLNVQGQIIDLTIPKIMCILNVTPDSFYDGGLYLNEKAIVDRARKALEDGATFVDIGGYSSRPGATHISAEEEIRRVKTTVEIVKREVPQLIISIDTFRSEVARTAIGEGASLVNDISGGTLDDKMYDTIAELKVPYIMMHMKGTPQTMTQFAHYDNLMLEITDYFQKSIYALFEKGIKDVIIDPGFGFAKTRDHNFELLNQLELLRVLGKPILAGLSRKSMIWKTLGVQPEQALNGTTALNAIALMKGADILRVHDVNEAVQVVKLVSALKDKSQVNFG
jgi:dihydropteroate synthase